MMLNITSKKITTDFCTFVVAYERLIKYKPYEDRQFPLSHITTILPTRCSKFSK